MLPARWDAKIATIASAITGGSPSASIACRAWSSPTPT
jgi:hypothetical protein